MTNFKNEFETSELNEASKPEMTVELEDGKMEVYVEELNNSGNTDLAKVTIKYNGLKASYVTDGHYTTSKTSGDGYEILNNLIQNLFMSGSIKTK